MLTKLFVPLKGIIFLFFMLSLPLRAQNYPTRFLGFPIDGPKSVMLENLKEKGFEYHADGDFLTGVYFGEPVYIFMNTRDSKLNRILIYDIVQRNAMDITKRFNEVYEGFLANKNYEYMSGNPHLIVPKEDIEVEMATRHKSYKVVFKQNRKTAADSIMIQQEALEPARVSPMNISEMIKGYKQRINRIYAKGLMRSVSTTDDRSMNQVWMEIVEKQGKYALVVSFDNLYNFSQPSDEE